MRPRLHALIDISASSSEAEAIRDHLEQLSSPDALGGVAWSVTVLLPLNVPPNVLPEQNGWRCGASARPIGEANDLLRWAADNSCHLLVLLGMVQVTGEALGTLLEIFKTDPHFGVSIPRQVNVETHELLRVLEQQGDPEINLLSRRVLAEIPDYYVVPELLSPCMLMRDSVVENLPLLDETFDGVAGAMAQYLTVARRTGFRTVLANRALIASPASTVPAPSKADTRRLHSLYPDAGAAKSELAQASLHVRESLLGRLFSPQTYLRKSLLLDLRGVRNFMNGTAEAVLALCDAVKQLDTDWNVSLLAEPATAAYHQLETRYAPWPVLTNEAGRYFTVALRPSQPWYINTMIELHRAALLNFYAMLDTISWDILFEAPVGLGACWDFMCQYADGLLYNSYDTQHHMSRRFAAAEKACSYVFHHSFHPSDYTDPSLLDLDAEGDYILIIGNSYDHKHLKPTVELLTASFPYQKIRVLGLKSSQHERVQALESGKLPTSVIEELFAKARLIVFPSFYEGFGFPVLKGLSYGRTVVARRSSLLAEIASNYRGPGTLLDFSKPAELVEAAGRAIHNQVIQRVELGSALQPGQAPKSWIDIGRGLIEFLEKRMADTASLGWSERERAIRQIASAT